MISYGVMWLLLWGFIIACGLVSTLGIIRDKRESRRQWKDFQDISKRFWD